MATVNTHPTIDAGEFERRRQFALMQVTHGDVLAAIFRMASALSEFGMPPDAVAAELRALDIAVYADDVRRWIEGL